MKALIPSKAGEKRLASATTWDTYLQKRLSSDSKFKTLWEKDQPIRELREAVLRLRLTHELTQKELADKMQTDQANISKLERGQSSPSVAFLVRLAQVFNRKLEIRFTSL